MAGEVEEEGRTLGITALVPLCHFCPCATCCDMLVAEIMPGGCGDGNKCRSCIISFTQASGIGRGVVGAVTPCPVPGPPLFFLHVVGVSTLTGLGAGGKGLCRALLSPESPLVPAWQRNTHPMLRAVPVSQCCLCSAGSQVCLGKKPLLQ